jgi:hypothetical protein
MGPITIINTFNHVKFDVESKPLVICDIDHTFMRCSYDLEHFRQILDCDYKPFSNNYLEFNYKPPDDKEAFNLMNNAYNLGFVKQTDEEGFNQMLKTIDQLNGKLIFLTARGILSHEKTIRELKRAGLQNPENYDIHYTNSEISKGEYIKKTNLTDGYQHISFIDDYPNFIESVYNIFPYINCYLFRYDHTSSDAIVIY